MAEMIIFRLLDRKVDKTSFFLNSDGTEDHDNKLNFTNDYGLVNPFYIITKEGKRIHKRYIKGCDHFDIAQQEKEKLVANLSNSVVSFTKGADIILDSELMLPLVTWLQEHPMNLGSKNHKADLHEAVFFEFNPKLVVTEKINTIAEEDQALEVLRAIRNDADKMRAIGVLFAETQNIHDQEELYLELRSIALKQPTLFNKTILDKKSKVTSEVRIALSLGVIELDAKEYLYAESKGTIFSVAGLGKKVQEESLIDFLMTAEGVEHYKNILVKTQQKEIELNAVKE